MRIVFMGSPEFTIPILALLQANGHDIAAVYTRPDKPAGRGREPAPPPIKKAALALGLPVVQVSGFKNPQAVAELAAFRPQAVIVAAFGLILPQTVLDVAPFGSINVHPSLLPKYRGPSPVVSTLLAGEEFAGVSVMQLDAGMDSGPVLFRAQIGVLDSDDAGTLTAKLFEIGAALVMEALAAAPGGKLRPEPQDTELATITREIVKEDGRIDWNRSALEIWRQVRAYRTWPQAYCDWRGKQLKILESQPLKSNQTLEPGRVALVGEDKRLAVGAGSGLLEIKMLQIEGKRAMSARDFLTGQKEFVNSRLE